MADTFQNAYEEVYVNGLHESTRGGDVTSVKSGVSVGVPSGMFPVRAGCNPAIGLIEGLQFIAGTGEMSAIEKAAPNAKLELFGLNSFYGPRSAAQFPRVIEQIRNDRGTRQAVVIIAHPDDSPETVPCTLSAQFQTDKYSMLTATFTMRSTDMVWGLPYDLIQFGIVATAVASCVGCIGSEVVVNTANAHIYDATSVRITAWNHGYYMMPNLFEEWSDWQRWAKGVVYKRYCKEELLQYFSVQ